MISQLLKETDLKRRRQHIVNMAAGAWSAPNKIKYLPHEDKIWQIVSSKLHPIWNEFVIDELLEARETLRLPIDHVPQLSEVTGLLAKTSGFEYRAVPGLVPIDEFFGALSRKQFLSTQYLRNPKNALYTPEPDIIHEVIGHATCLTNAKLALLHELAGKAFVRVKTTRAKKFVSDIFWFSGEFGVIRKSQGTKAYGAGILSSVGELEGFTKNATIHKLDIKKMGTTEYHIDATQTDLFAADSLDHLIEVVGGFFRVVTDELVAELLKESKS